MRKLGWYALRVVVTAFVLACLLLLAANLYVQSHSVQQRIHDAVEGNLKMSVRLQKTTVTPWEGLRLDGVVIRPEEPEDSSQAQKDHTPDLFTAASFRVRLAWWPLLTQGRTVVESVLLDKPQLTWQQDDDGRWNFPPGQDRIHLAEANELARDDAEATAPGDPAVSPSLEDGAPPLNADATPTPGSLSAVEKSATDAAGDARSKGFQMLVSKLRVRDGRITIRDREQNPLLHIEGLNSDGTIPDPHHANGAVWFAKADVPSGLAIANYWTAVDFDDEVGLTVRDGRGTVAGGTIRTDFRLRPQENGRTFSTDCKLDNVALAQLAHRSANQPPVAEGQFFASLDCHGFTDDATSRAGAGHLSLIGAKLVESAPLKLLGQVMRISDLARLEFKQAEADYKIEGTTVRIESIVLVTNDVRVLAHGTYATDRDQLEVHGRMTIDQAVGHQLPQFIESNFTPCGPEAPGSRYLDFDVTGPLDDLKSNFYDRVTAGPMKGLLDNLLTPKSKNPKNKTRGRDTNVRPSPEASQVR